MIAVRGARIEAVFGCTPADGTDNRAFLAPLFGEAKAKSIVESTGFAVRRAAPKGASPLDLALPAARAALEGVDPAAIGAVVFVSFSSPSRYPSLAQLAAKDLALPRSVAALDVALACSGYPSGLYAAAAFARDSGKKALLLDADVQTAFLDPADAASNAVMGDGGSATLVSPGEDGMRFSFMVDGSLGDALVCPASGPVAMRGFDVYRYVTVEAAGFLKGFLAECGVAPDEPVFVPHQANLYMIRRLAEAIGCPAANLAVSGDRFGNPGSASVPMTLAADSRAGLSLLAGYGAGLSASAALVSIPSDCRRGIVEA